jgi:hypothetical protein
MSKIDMFRKTIRINPKTNKRLSETLKLGRWVNETELIRQALNIGLDKIENNYSFKNSICPVCHKEICRDHYVLRDDVKYHMECVK